MVLSWRARRQAFYVAIPLIPILIIGGWLSYRTLTNATCDDGRLNQGERGIDCEGPCPKICEARIISLDTKWSRAFLVRPNAYNVVALLENRNADLSAESVSYSFTLYDKSGQVVGEYSGTTPIPLQQSFAVFGGPVSTTGQVESVSFVVEEPQWKINKGPLPQIEVVSTNLSNIKTRPELSAEIRNNSLDTYQNTELIAVLSDEVGNAIHVSKTQTDLPSRSTKKITYTWPQPFELSAGVCLKPVDMVLAIDRSGSMNNDSDEPPQPLTSVKEAAISFINRFSSSDRIGIVSFATTANNPIDAPISAEKEITRQVISDLEVLPEDEEGYTNIASAIDVASEALLSLDGRQSQVIILLTDGKSTYPLVDPEAAAIEAAQQARSNNISIYAIGLGSDVDKNLLEDIAGNNNRAFFAANTSQLQNIYTSIATTVCERMPYAINIYPIVHGGAL